MPPKQNQNKAMPQSTTPAEDFELRETSPRLGRRTRRVGTAFDLVEEMHYLYVKVVKGKEFATKDGNGGPDPFVEVKLGSFKGMTRQFSGISDPGWDHVFALLTDRIETPVIEVLVRDKKRGGDDLVGMVCFDLIEVPRRVPPDSPLAPQWYRLENRRGEKVRGELMLAIWKGTQADEAFSEAHQLDVSSGVTGDGVVNIRSKVYLTPRLWYVRVNVIEALELHIADKNRQMPECFVKVTLGNVTLRTKISQSRSLSPLWNEDLMFVAAEPFEEALTLSVEERVGPNKDECLGKCLILLNSVEKRVDFKTPMNRWYGLAKNVSSDKGENQLIKANGRVHLRICLDGGYHVLDELTQYSSDLRASAKQLWKPAIGVLELGILSAQGLSSMKTKNGIGMTDAYCVAKYGQKWIRTRTVLNDFKPRWNEQYTWDVFDPCTVITVGVFDNCHLQGGEKAKDSRIGKVRIRLSNLETERVYTHSYPLHLLTPTGVKKMGEIQLALRFSCSSLLNLLQMYNQPLLPTMHYLHPLSCHQIDNLRHQATQLISTNLSRSEPSLRKEIVEYMLDVGSNLWSMRRMKVNHQRVASIFSVIACLCRWFNEICDWKNPMSTITAHTVLLCFVSFPQLLLCTVFFSIFIVGAGRYRKRPRHPPHMDIRLSQADKVHPDEMDEEFDSLPTSRQGDVVRMRYDRIRSIVSRLQTVVGDFATQGERFYSLLSWRDPRATFLFLIFCLLASLVAFVVPFKVLVIVAGFYRMRHPRFRERLPASPLNFFRRLPARSDSLL